MFDQKMPRRTVLKGALAALAAIPVVAAVSRAAAAPAAAKIDPNDAADPLHGQVTALGYVVASKTAGQNCANCSQFQGKAGDKTGGCTIFGGRMVDAAGWCKVWSKKA